jgi:alpha-glucosidase (family GH31 glycosyl hydrolase)
MRRDGYNTVQYCEQVVANYIQNQIPLETFLTDIQYMDQNQDFTLSNQYPLSEFATFVANLHNNSQRWASHHCFRNVCLSSSLELSETRAGPAESCAT